MTKPRQILPGACHLVSRRCTQRIYLLRPSKAVEEVVLYCLAYAMAKTGVKVHAFVVMSNHLHLVVTDPYGKLPEFAHLLHRHIANALNARYGRWENFWAAGSYSDVQLDTVADIARKILYTLLNPVEAGLVKRATQWPGLTSAGIPFGAKIKARRPKFYFREDGEMPDELDLVLTVPPKMKISQRKLTETIQHRSAEMEAVYQREAARRGRKFLGAKRCRQVRPFDRPRSREPRRGLNPRVAGALESTRIAAIRRLKSFWSLYEEARRRWRDGARNVLFPHGTYGLRVFAKVQCRGPTMPDDCPPHRLGP